jgi:hypothetical protein
MGFAISNSFLALRAEPFVVMWLIALGMYAICKWLSWRMAAGLLPADRRGWRLAYLLGYPGMNAGEFFERRSPNSTVSMRSSDIRSFGFILVKIIVGSILL